MDNASFILTIAQRHPRLEDRRRDHHRWPTLGMVIVSATHPDRDAIWDEVIDWLAANTESKWHFYGNSSERVFTFADPKEALHMKMRFA